MNREVLCLLTTDFEEIETIAPIDLLRRAGAKVTMATLTYSPWVTGRCQITIQAGTVLDQVQAANYDLLFIPGGPGVKALRADGRPARLAQEFAQDGKLVAAICAGPLVLLDAGLLQGRRYTAHFSTQAELPQAQADEKVVVDGKIITSRGAGTAIEFGLELVRILFDEAKAKEVARSIML